MTALAGCGIGAIDRTSTGNLAINGHVHGGLQPVAGATIELFAVGTAGNGSLANNILNRTVTTDIGSNFDITGAYTCSSPDEQVYLAALGGNPGLAGSVNNHALVLLSALGSCTALLDNPNVFITVNEVSTVAAAYALAPFMTAYDHAGASATNITGIANAFLNAQLLTNSTTGQAADLPSNLSIERGKLYALANAIAPCVNSDGGSACAPLFTAATVNGGPAPGDVLSALLNIVKHPGRNVASVFNLAGPMPPYGGALSRPPNDWTMSFTASGGGIFEPTGLAIDKFGNVWVANYGGPAATTGQNPTGVVAYSPQGTPLSSTPYNAGPETEVYALTLDRNGDAWITSTENQGHGGTTGSVGKIFGASSSTPGVFAGEFYDNTLDYPESIASDPAGNGTILIGNYANNTATVYDLNGNFVKNVGAGYAVFPVGITSDDAGGLWLANQGDFTITHVPATGTPQVVRCCSGPDTVALDPQGNVWVTNHNLDSSSQYTISEVSSAGTVLIDQENTAGIYAPGGAAVDAGGQFWIANYYANSISEVAGNTSSVPAGTGLSPFPYGKDANLGEPYAIAPDASGNLWLSNRTSNSVTMFFGLATPTATPATPRPSLP